MLASVVISTYNRAEALPATLVALARQDITADRYEVLVIDDGSADHTARVLAEASMPYALRIFHQPENRGVSAGRNVGLRAATGQYVIMISDDLIVPENFIRTHVATLERFPDSWVVGGFAQMESLTETPFGRYLNGLEESFERARTGARIDDDIYEMTMPTARNLSLPRSDLDRVGYFDERFRATCEDQDLAQRAAERGIRFIYNASLKCVHKDQAADLQRYCRFQERGAHDTVRLCMKYPDLHGHAPVVKVNGHIRRADPAVLIVRKLVKRILSTPVMTALVERIVGAAEFAGLPDRWLARGYRMLVGLYTFRGFREGLRDPVGSQAETPSGWLVVKEALKRLRAFPPVNAPVTHAVRATMRALRTESESVVKHLPHVGTAKMVLPGKRQARLWSHGDDWVSNQVFWRGWDGYEPEMTPLFWRLATGSSVTLDVGAHVGFYSLLAAIANPGGSVFAFEPLPAVFERLRRNLALNGLKNVFALRQAVGAADGEEEFFHVPGIIPCSSSLSEEFMAGAPRVEHLRVKVVRIETFARARGLAKIELIKMDTETTEPDVLRGMGGLLAEWRPNIFCEVLPRGDGDALTAILKPLGYSFYLLTDTGPQRRERVVPDPRWFNYLFTLRSELPWSSQATAAA